MALHQLDGCPRLQPGAQLAVEAPIPAVQLLRRVNLQDVPRHGVEHVEQRLYLELRQVLCLERWGMHHVALRCAELRVGGKHMFREG